MSDIHDLLHIFKLPATAIITIERSELFHWITTLPGFVLYPRNLLLPLVIPLPYKDGDKQSETPQKSGPSHPPVVLPSNTLPDTDSTSQGHVSSDQTAISKPEIV